jgi:outer membrane protein assembly factor BamB
MPGGVKGRVVALDPETGDTVWANTEIEHTAAYCSPTIITHRGVRQWVSMTQRSVVSLDPETGELLWTVPFSPRTPQNALTPIYHAGHVFVAAGHSSGGTLLKIADDSRSASVVWHRRELDNCHSGSILLDGKLFGAACRNGGRHFYCVDFLTGENAPTGPDVGQSRSDQRRRHGLRVGISGHHVAVEGQRARIRNRQPIRSATPAAQYLLGPPRDLRRPFVLARRRQPVGLRHPNGPVGIIRGTSERNGASHRLGLA